ncbi:hypothetical protein ACN38_g7670 [Penicillium nordicum]|uniref:Uncharacterized protein n=1 Tax=Penicillium nordicum TaxID=229535 RepID=A0A0M8P643_9EURO|nr:hypothetical protein ACN38_g7670 [Penicillium nordicum]
MVVSVQRRPCHLIASPRAHCSSINSWFGCGACFLFSFFGVVPVCLLQLSHARFSIEDPTDSTVQPTLNQTIRGAIAPCRDSTTALHIVNGTLLDLEGNSLSWSLSSSYLEATAIGLWRRTSVRLQ